MLSNSRKLAFVTLLALALVSASAAYSGSISNEGDVVTFTYQGSKETWTVPETGEYELRLWGAEGGDGGSGGVGGDGGYIEGHIYLEKGETVNVRVGGEGAGDETGSDWWDSTPTVPGGFNGGGDGGDYQNSGSENYGGGGGGATDVRVGGDTLWHRVAVAGGGGGASDESGDDGGYGGYPRGGDGGGSHGPDRGRGATQYYGGKDGDGWYRNGEQSEDGSFGQGGDVVQRDDEDDGDESCAGGGGGGWYGGGAGEDCNGGGGGGGSSYFGPLTQTTYTNGARNNNGRAEIELVDKKDNLENITDTDLEAYYRFDRSSGRIIDRSGNDNHGTLVGNVKRSKAICNTDNACGFGESDYFIVGDDSTLDVSGDMTLSFWVKSEDSNDALIGTSSNPAKSCTQIYKNTDYNIGSGFYYIDPDNSGSVEVYCDMQYDSGGWTLTSQGYFSGDPGFLIQTSANRRPSNGDYTTDIRRFESAGFRFVRTGADTDRGTNWGDIQSDRDVYNKNDEGAEGIYDWLTCMGQGCSAFSPNVDYKCSWGDTWADTGSSNDNYQSGFPSNDWNLAYWPGTTRWNAYVPAYDFGNGENLVGGENDNSDGPKSCNPNDERTGYWMQFVKEEKNAEANYTKGTVDGINKPGSYGIEISDTGVESRLYLSGRSKPTQFEVTDSELDSGWDHVSMTWDESENEISIYVNGDLKGTRSYSNSLQTSNSPLKVGGFSGQLSDLRIYDAEVTPKDFAQDYRKKVSKGDEQGLRVNLINQTDSGVKNANVTLKKAGTNKRVCKDLALDYETNANGDVLFPALDQTKIYNVIINPANSVYKSQLEFQNIRLPEFIEAGKNQNFIPESTYADSVRFSAGHVLPAQTFVTRPFSNFDVVNVSVEKYLNSSFRLVSDILVRKYNVQFGSSFSSWSNRKTVSIQEIYGENWDDDTGGNNDAWGTIEFNPQGAQNVDCSDVRLTDTNNNVQDYTINTCTDDKVELEFNVDLSASKEEDHYIYYGNSGATDAQTAVQRPSRSLKADFDTGKTAFTETFFVKDEAGDDRQFNISVPQNIAFTSQSIKLRFGNRTDYENNTVPVTLGTGYQDFTGMEFEPTREYILEYVTLELENTTADTELVIRNQSSGNILYTKPVADNGEGTYILNFHNQSKNLTGENQVYYPGHRYLMMIRDGEAKRASTANNNRPMYNLNDTIMHRQLFGCNTDGSGCTEGDYPNLVKGIDTVDPDYPQNVTVYYNGTQIFKAPRYLNETHTIDVSSYLKSQVWREGDPIDDPRVHPFNITVDTTGNISVGMDVTVEFEHPVTEVTKSANACSVNPDSQTYFYIDRSDCAYLDRVNVSDGQWFRLDYRFRIPGPHDFSSVGEVNQYNVSDTMLRFDVLTETEEFTG